MKYLVLLKQFKKKVTLNEKNFNKYLQTKDIPDPDLLIRTVTQIG